MLFFTFFLPRARTISSFGEIGRVNFRQNNQHNVEGYFNTCHFRATVLQDTKA